jgi:hypothetical protein
VDGLRLGNASVVHEHEADPQRILRQWPGHFLLRFALGLHLTLQRSLNPTPFHQGGTPNISCQSYTLQSIDNNELTG